MPEPAPLHHVLDTIVQSAVQVVQAEAAGLYLLEEGSQELVFEVVLGGGGAELETTRIKVGQGIPGLVVQTREPAIVQTGEGALDVSGFKPRNVLCVPLLDGHQVLGALALYNAAADHGFTMQDMSVLMAFGNVAAAAVNQAAPPDSRLTPQFSRQQVIDEVTHALVEADDKELKLLSSIVNSVMALRSSG